MSRSLALSSLALAAGLVLLGAGCASSAPSAAPTSADGSSSVPALVATRPGETGAPAMSACAHPYYPLKQGYNVRYRISSRDFQGAPQVTHYNQRVTSADANSVTLTTQFEDTTGATTFSADQALRCDGGHLRATAYVDFSSQLMGGAAPAFRTETRNVTGDLLPADLQVGSDWTGSFAVTMTPANAAAENAPLGRGIDLTIRTHRRVVGEETVTVPAGTYQALKIQAETGMDGIAGGSENTDLVTTEWWVRGVGLVKSVFAAGGAMGDIVTEASSINVP
ncbi:hypothetical protein KBA73_04400 [Patescibacteria group bacterium]|nr:hypothetical protein [Patescibacteria group bacterium]